MSDTSHVMKESIHVEDKKIKERLNVLVCANMEGTSRYTLIVNGEIANPRCFRGGRNFIFGYSNISSAWMKGFIFEKWLKTWYRQLLPKHKKSCLIVDNYMANPPDVELLSIEIFFFRPMSPDLSNHLNRGLSVPWKLNIKIFQQESGDIHWCHFWHSWKRHYKIFRCSGRH